MANEGNLTPFTKEQSREEAVKNGKKGGIASGKKKKERKLIADALRKVLDEPLAKGSRQTKLDGLAIKTIKKMFDNPNIKSMKILAEILGEFEGKQNLEVNGSMKFEGFSSLMPDVEGIEEFAKEIDRRRAEDNNVSL